MSARSALRIAQKQEAERLARLESVLRDNKKKAPDVIDLKTIFNEIERLHPDKRFRGWDTFRKNYRTKDLRKIRLEVANHVYAKYNVPPHLTEIWTSDKLSKDTNEYAYQSRWYITVASGGSLHKEVTSDFFTKKETHMFLNVPFRIPFKEAILYALASNYTNNVSIIKRITKCKLLNFISAFQMTRINLEFWRTAIKLFVDQDIKISHVNDLIDYFEHCLNQDRKYSLKGRTHASLVKQMEDWHRGLARVKRMGNAIWKGNDMEDKVTQTVYEGVPWDWWFMQVKTSKDLAAEGNKMRHCVYGYQSMCISGRVSIWSVRAKKEKDNQYLHSCTLEMVNDTKTIVQARGFANRGLNNKEKAAVSKWCAENGVQFRDNRY